MRERLDIGDLGLLDTFSLERGDLGVLFVTGDFTFLTDVMGALFFALEIGEMGFLLVSGDFRKRAPIEDRGGFAFSGDLRSTNAILSGIFSSLNVSFFSDSIRCIRFDILDMVFAFGFDFVRMAGVGCRSNIL